MENNVYIFFKRDKKGLVIDSVVVEVDGVEKGIIKEGEELKIQLDKGNHIIEIYMYDKKKCYAKKELNINKTETYLTYESPVMYPMKGKILEVTKDKYKKKRKYDKLYIILLFILAIIIYIILV